MPNAYIGVTELLFRLKSFQVGKQVEQMDLLVEVLQLTDVTIKHLYKSLSFQLRLSKQAYTFSR